MEVLMKIADWPENERPREKLLAKGPASLSDAELLALFLQTGVNGKSAIDVGRDLLHQFKNLRSLVDASQAELCSMRGLGTAKYVLLKAALELGKRYIEETLKRDAPLKSPEMTRHFLKARLRAYPHEVFACLFLDNRHRIITFEELFTGTIDGASVHPREVVKRTLFHNAAAVIFAHNHPSGVAEPSQADKGITRRLVDALALIDVRVLDHFVIGDEEVTSFAERGLL
jgi:DNA repair protein RadC